ncbi:hypothetical protein [Zwartia sp.]|uniref:hypothetical protein n=1 Tax=Zwartia sp. TaxID=2978004 RepID=UPI00271C5937|nr:hypothetical protein [Zwartia sp.]MDO9025962.1 hypothetical protein [Zwartia sp.]
MAVSMWRWIDRNILELGREVRLSYLPPLMVYMAAGISSLTGIVGTFFVKDYLNLSVAFLAALSFWVVIPWSLKMVLGHLIDLLWRWKSAMLFFGASLIASSLLIMIGLIGAREAMAAWLPVEAWYVMSALLAPIGYVVQDAVADAMTVEAVPRVEDDGQPIDPERRKLMHTTMQTLGRVAIIGGSVFVAVINLYVFAGVQQLDEAQKVQKYLQIYMISMAIPLISVLGVVLASALHARAHKRLLSRGMTTEQAQALLRGVTEATKPNWMILGGSLVFVMFTMTMGLAQVPFGQEIIFVGSMAIVTFLIGRLTKDLEPQMRSTLVGTAIVIFVFRAIPSPGPGVTWWMIDELKFDQHFFSILSLIASALTLLGMFMFRRFMAERSIAYVVGTLTLFGTVLALPTYGMFYGLHHWTSAMTGGVVDARFIAIIDAALESPLGQVAMIPMLAWIARSAPENLKATYFAVMASFTNLALSASQLGTKYLNQIFTVSREVRNPTTGVVEIAANYTSLGSILTVSILIGLTLPFAAILFVRFTRFKSS